MARGEVQGSVDLEGDSAAAQATGEVVAGTPVESPAPGASEPQAGRRLWPTVQAFGRTWPKAGWVERGMWTVLLLSCYAVLYLAAFVLSPDTRGIGTHEQLGLPECGFVSLAGGPCPSCGFTTTFTLAAHLRPVDALVNQPFGAFLFVLTVLGALGLPVVCARGISLFSLTDRWPWVRIGTALLGAWLVCWGYKWFQVVP